MTPTTILIAFLVLIIFISIQRFLYYKSNMKARQEQTLFLLDKFATPQELTAFLQSEEGKTLLQLLGWNDGSRNLRVLSLTFQILGIFILILAFALVVLGFFAPDAKGAKEGWTLAFLLAMLGGGAYFVHRVIRRQIDS